MKILIALASCSADLSGVQRHAINLAHSLLSRTEISQVHLIAAPWQQQMVGNAIASVIKDTRLHLHAADIGNSAMSRNMWFYRQLPEIAAGLNVDLVHLAYPMPLNRPAFHCPVVVTLHDLYPYDIPGNFGFLRVFFNRAVLRQSIKAADTIVCVSQSTQTRLDDIESHLAPHNAVVIHNSVEPPDFAAMVKPAWVSAPFLLCVAQHRRNKNIPLALRVFKRLQDSHRLPFDTRLQIVGIPGPDTAAIKRCIGKLHLADHVDLRQGVPEHELQWCYGNCLLLLAPSVVEGFGLPVAEALLAGCHVVCSDIPIFRETGGNRCHYATLGPHAEDSFVAAALAALDSPPAAPVALPNLSVQIIADQYIQLYRSLVPAAREREFPMQTSLRSAGGRQVLS